MKTKLTPQTISREEALNLSPEYVAFIENGWEYNDFDKFLDEFNALKKGNKVVSYLDGNFVIGKVSLVDPRLLGLADSPTIRIASGNMSWRCDGDKFAAKIK
jgi:hypothetical protein